MPFDGRSLDYWSRHKGYAPNWFSLCAPVIRERITGDRNVEPTTWAIGKVTGGQRVGSMLEIGCLAGDKLARFAGHADRLVGVDYAEGAIERGRAAHPDIEFHVMDLNVPSPLGETFDLIHANGVLHHIENLEACVSWIRDHLAPGGALIASEFTGPRRYLYTEADLAEIERATWLLPKELQHRFDLRSLDPKLEADPTESVRTDIEAVLRSFFADVEVRPYGGNVLQRMLGPDFFKAFDPANPSHISGLRRVVSRDNSLMMKHSHHAYFIARHAGASHSSQLR